MLRKLLFLSALLLAFACGKDDETKPAPDPGTEEPAEPEVKKAAELKSFVFEASKNPQYLIDDVECTIKGNEVSGLVPYTAAIDKLIPTFSGEFVSATVGGKAQQSGVTQNDFSSPVVYTLTGEDGKTAEYKVTFFNFTGLPIVSVWTTNRQEITSKEDYVEGTVSISKTADFDTGYEGPMKIRGRGNATWFSYPKKAYRIKLNEKSEMLGMPADKDWVLLANYCDKSLIRLSVAFKLSEMMGLPWTPRTEFVEFFLNGNYNGTYLFGEHVKVAKNRLNVTDDGYLIERDNYYEQEPFYFTTGQGHHYTFKHPDITGTSDPNLTFIAQYMNDFEQALYSSDFADPNTGYRKYVDVQSIIDWYLIQVVLSNKDTNLYFFKNDKQPASKLGMAPVWDFEWSLGIGWNTAGPADPAQPVQAGFYFDRMREDPYFRNLLVQRWNKMKQDYLPKLYDYINEMARRISVAQKVNFQKWNILHTPVSVEVITPGTWENEVTYVKDFLSRRIQFLETAIPANRY